MALRNLEPPLGYLARHADPDLDGAGLRDALELNLRQHDWPVVQTGRLFAGFALLFRSAA
uniref:Uncharacterized protein n=1 Tax=mine drainage metagenome TaxID=410659 RepID=E6QBJ5_9ZZZZ